MTSHTDSQDDPSRARVILLVLGILLIATTLRAPITGVAPVLGLIREGLGLGPGAAGTLTTLPLLAFALASPFAVLIGREYGLERSLFAAVVLVFLGILLRSLGPVWSLFLGTGIIGIGIALANVLLPSLLKRDFPDSIVALTSAYALAAGVAGASVSALAVPIATLPGGGWALALGAVAVLPLLSALVWLPQLAARTAPGPETATPPHGGKVWHSALAWQVTLFFGLNSLVFYVVMTWLPAILTDAGYSEAAAGSTHGLMQLATAVPGLFFGLLVRRLADQRGLAIALTGLMAVSLLGLVVMPGAAVLWSVVFGVAVGAVFILGLTFISLRSANMHQAAALSGMVQCAGYLIAAAAPPSIGALHDRLGGWSLPLLLCVAICLIMAVLGGFAGRAVQISAE
ncbi:MFS transporter [Paracoccus aminophilus]|uniref:Cyanate transport protein n=1 Tax=Paracoccus aminophilus JCM 7686 TaxID=1367847 RepID=S5Y0B0_PARAH|nr:MFS transporter [Paracoccus aminophilus]AGT10972.1 cyanate transport protein [Paracoccus aminophilus JCM 7686]